MLNKQGLLGKNNRLRRVAPYAIFQHKQVNMTSFNGNGGNCVVYNPHKYILQHIASICPKCDIKVDSYTPNLVGYHTLL